MWIHPENKLSLEELSEEVKTALAAFEKDRQEGKLVPFDVSDAARWEAYCKRVGKIDEQIATGF